MSMAVCCALPYCSAVVFMPETSGKASSQMTILFLFSLSEVRFYKEQEQLIRESWLVDKELAIGQNFGWEYERSI